MSAPTIKQLYLHPGSYMVYDQVFNYLSNDVHPVHQPKFKKLKTAIFGRKGISCVISGYPHTKYLRTEKLKDIIPTHIYREMEVYVPTTVITD